MFPNRVVNNRHKWCLFGAVGALLLLAAAAIGPAAAAGGTTVSSTPTEAATDVRENTTVQIVVDDAQGGVGAAEFRVSVDENIAEISDVDVHGSGSTKVTTADNGSFVEVEYAFQDTADTGSVTIADVAVLGHSDGSTAVNLEAATGNDKVLVFDEGGTGYDVTDIDAATLRVGDTDSSGSSGNNQDSSAPSLPTENDDDTQNINRDSNEDIVSDPRDESPSGTQNQDANQSSNSVSDSAPGFGSALTVVALLITAGLFRAHKS